MRKLIAVLLGGLAFGAVFMNQMPTAGAAGTTCTGVMQNVEIFGDVTVPANTLKCSMTNVKVHGNVSVQKGSTLDTSGVLIDQNLTFSDAYDMSIFRTRVDGSISIVGAGSEKGMNYGFGTLVVGGNFSFTNSIDRVMITKVTTDNWIGGSVTVSNTGGIGINYTTVNHSVLATNNFGQTYFKHSTIQGALQCAGNNPQPTAMDLVAPNKFGQCANI